MLQHGNESMNVKRLDELVAEKKILHTAERSCQTDLSTAKLDAQRAQAALTHRIEKEKEKAKDAETVKPPPLIPKAACPRKQLGGKCLPPLPDAGGTLKIEGTVRVEPTAKPSGPADGQTHPTPAPSKPRAPSPPK